MKGISIIKKLWIFSFIFIVLLGVQMLMVNGLTAELKQDLINNDQVNKPMTRALHQIQVSVIQTQQWLTDISATRGLDGLDDGFKEAAESASLLDKAVQELIQLDPQNADKYRGLLPIYQAYYETGQKMAHAYIDQGPEGGNKIMGEFDATAEAIYGMVNKFLDVFDRMDQERLLEQKEDSQQLEILNYGFALAYLVLLAILIYGGVQFVTAPAAKLVDTLHKIASGDLSQKIDIKTLDEIGEIAQTTNQIVENLGGILSKVSSQGMMISAYSQATNMVVTDTAHGIDQQKLSANEIHQVMDSMNESVDQIDTLSQRAQHSASQAAEEASKGKQVVEQNIQSINILAEELKKTAGNIQELNQSSEQISSVLKVIQDIAEQTNLLALNAAIEAARAGEQGRGFAVVADEVRTLAARTQGSAQEIKDMIDSLLQGTRNSVEMMESSHAKVQASVEQSAAAGQSLQEITDAVEQIQQMNNQIAAATASQKSVSNNVNGKINQIVQSIEDVQKKSDVATNMGEQTKVHATEFTDLILDLKLIEKKA